MSLYAEIEALRRDASTWAGGSDSMAGTMERTALVGEEQLPVTFPAIADETGLSATYEQLRQKAVRLMGEAASNFDAIATVLTAAADEYERTDGESDEAIRNSWVLRGDD